MPKYDIRVEAGAKEFDKKIKEAQRDERKSALKDASKNQELVKELRDLKAALRENTRASRMAAKGAVVGGAAAGAGGIGGGVGRIGASLPFLGATIAATGYVVQQVMRIGQANIQKRMEQMSTAGLTGGLLYRSISPTMSIAQSGQYLRERAMAAGRFERGLPGQYGGPSTAMMYASTFGVSPTEAARTVGLLDVSSKGRGEAQFAQIADILMSGGVQTEMPTVIGAITAAMEESVREGVNNSDLATDMAGEISMLTQATSNQQARAAIQTIQSMMQIQKSVAGGQFGGTAQYRMYKAAESLLSQTGIQEQLMQSGYFAEGTDFQKMDYAQRRVAVQYLMQQREGTVRTEYVKQLVGSLSGEGSREERMRRFHVLSQDLGLSSSPEESKRLFEMGEAQAKGVTPKVKEGIATEELKKRGVTEATTAQQMQNQLDSLTLSQGEAAKMYVTMNQSLITLANEAGPAANSAIGTLNDTLVSVVDTTAKSIEKLKELMKKSEEGESIWNLF